MDDEEDSNETKEEEKYEEEDLLEAEGYYTKESDSENEVDWLGFNPWTTEEISEYEQYLTQWESEANYTTQQPLLPKWKYKSGILLKTCI